MKWCNKMNKSIDEIMEMLNENNDIEVQKKGIELGKKIKNFNVFIQPRCGRDSELLWENCAEIVCSKKDKELLFYDTNLILWARDYNKPGAIKIRRKLKEIYSNPDDKYNIFRLDELIKIVENIDGENEVLTMLLEFKNALEVSK